MVNPSSQVLTAATPAQEWAALISQVAALSKLAVDMAERCINIDAHLDKVLSKIALSVTRNCLDANVKPKSIDETFEFTFGSQLDSETELIQSKFDGSSKAGYDTTSDDFNGPIPSSSPGGYSSPVSDSSAEDSDSDMFPSTLTSVDFGPASFAAASPSSNYNLPAHHPRLSPPTSLVYFYAHNLFL
ncbi:hypothetical protein B0H14DRAFT_2644520 [Mycena olivaceomarginata]|nr:hypothetical protein B0H14DRAFT_2644520 [Mycena olivaceomarginata]